MSFLKIGTGRHEKCNHDFCIFGKAALEYNSSKNTVRANFGKMPHYNGFNVYNDWKLNMCNLDNYRNKLFEEFSDEYYTLA